MMRWPFSPRGRAVAGRQWRAVAAVLAVGWLAGCAAPSKPLADAGTFTRHGRFAVHADTPSSDGTPQSVQGGFVWRDSGGVLRLDLANPFGTILARITVWPDRAEMQGSDGHREQAEHAEELVRRVTGRALPVAGLRDWLRGQTGPGATAVQVDAERRVTAFEQRGWRVRLSRYDAQGPGLLQLDYPDPGGGVRVRIAVERGA